MPEIILLNKPFDVLCQFTDSGGRSTLSDYISEPGFYAAGRLDLDSEGLVVLTNSGAVQHQISHPQKKMTKTYWVQVEGQPSHSDLEAIRRGISLSDGKCLPAPLKEISPPDIWPRNPPVRFRRNIPTTWLEIRLQEGRNRQVRRMTAAIGFPTLRLIRVSIGPWELGALQPGESQKLPVHVPSAATSTTSRRRQHSRSRGKRL